MSFSRRLIDATIPPVDDRVVIAAGARTPIGKFNGALAKVDAVELGAHAVRAALERTELEPDYVAVGNVLQAANGQNPGRRAALLGGVKREVPGITLNDVCLASMSAVAMAAAMIRAGEADDRAGRRLRLDDPRAARDPAAAGQPYGRRADDRRDGPRRPVLLDRRRGDGRDVGRRERAARGHARGAGPVRRGLPRPGAGGARAARRRDRAGRRPALRRGRARDELRDARGPQARLHARTARSPRATPPRCPTAPRRP